MNSSKLSRLFFVLSLLMQTFVSASEIDSLLLQLHKAEQDTTKAQIYNELIQFYLYVDINEANIYADSMLSVSERAHYSKGLGLVYGNKSTLALLSGEYEKALQFVKAEEEVNARMNYEYTNSQYHKGMGRVHYYMRNLDSSLYHFNRAAIEYRNQDNYSGLSEMVNSLGAVNYYLGNYDAALIQYREAQEIIESHTKDTLSLINIVNNIGLIFSHYQKAEKAIAYFETGLELAQIKNAPFSLDMLYFNLGDAYVLKEDYKMAIESFRYSLEIKKNNNIPYGTNLSRIGCFFGNTRGWNYTS